MKVCDIHRGYESGGCMSNTLIIIEESLQIDMMCVFSFDQAGETFLLPGLNLSNKLSIHRYHLM